MTLPLEVPVAVAARISTELVSVPLEPAVKGIPAAVMVVLLLARILLAVEEVARRSEAMAHPVQRELADLDAHPRFPEVRSRIHMAATAK
jgi:hypothetical protein